MPQISKEYISEITIGKFGSKPRITSLLEEMIKEKAFEPLEKKEALIEKQPASLGARTAYEVLLFCSAC